MEDRRDRERALRARVAELDLALAEAAEARARVSLELAGRPELAGVTAEGDREALLRLEGAPEGALPRAVTRALLAQATAAARALERPERAVYSGPEGGFCHLAAAAHLGASRGLDAVGTVAGVLEEVRRGRAALGVFAIDTSVDGLVVPAISALAETDLILVGEHSEAAVLSLMNQDGDPSRVSRIVGTAAAHAATEVFRGRAVPGCAVGDVASPAEAARLAAADPAVGALVPEATGLAAGLRVARGNVGDEPDLRIRYGVVGTRPASRTGQDVTSLLFSLDDAPGTLAQVLGHFAERGLNLRKIQSRPARGAPWDYLFYVEVGGHATDRPMVTALEAVKGATRYLKLLGSYPAER